MQKVILVGHPGSQGIVRASAYLTSKYLPDFHVTYLNHEGDINNWSQFMATYLETLSDEKVIFALDDYLLNKVCIRCLRLALTEGPCVKLCETTEEEHLEYPVTTQYTVWDRQLLIEILNQTTSPWDFEMSGSKVMTVKPTVRTCIYYDVHSALSNRWNGINLKGVKDEDLNFIKEHGYI